MWPRLETCRFPLDGGVVKPHVAARLSLAKGTALVFIVALGLKTSGCKSLNIPKQTGTGCL